MGCVRSPAAVSFVRGGRFRDVEGAIPYHGRLNPSLRLQSRAWVLHPMSETVMGRNPNVSFGKKHFVKQTERQYVADCRGRFLDIASRVMFQLLPLCGSRAAPRPGSGKHSPVSA